MTQSAGKMWYLKRIDLFENLDDEVMEDLGDITHVQDVPANQPIYFPGDTADTVFMLKKGRVRLSQNTKDGDTVTLAILEEGDIFGEMSLAGETERRNRAETKSNAFICSAPREKFMQILKENPGLNLEVTKMMGDRKRNVESRIKNLIFRDSESKVAYVLQDLFEYHSDDEDNVRTISFTQDEISNLAGLTRPTTSSILNEFQESDLIDLQRGKIRLVDEKRLLQKTRN
jgi:CRP-like cAMP-binding protein